MSGEGGAIELIEPDWPAPESVRAGMFTRSLRQDLDADFLADYLALDLELCLPRLEQVHGTAAVEVLPDAALRQADACYAREPGLVAMVRTADCLPVLVCDQAATEVAAIHAGWRGLASGVIESSLSRLNAASGSLMAWLGPCISQAHFEVGGEVREAFLDAAQAADRAETDSAFVPRNGKYMADLYALARIRLRRCGVEAVFGGGHCTYAEGARFHSFRRDGEQAGRLYSFIFMS